MKLTASHRWATLTGLQRPTLSQVLEIADCRSPKPVRPPSRYVLALGDNLFVRPHLARPDLVQSVTLVLVSDYFKVPTDVKTRDLEVFSLFGVRVPCSAETMRDSLQRRGLRGMAFSTMTDEWEIIIGTALVLHFYALKGMSGDPAQSVLKSLEFHFPPEYGGPPIEVGP